MMHESAVGAIFPRRWVTYRARAPHLVPRPIARQNAAILSRPINATSAINKIARPACHSLFIDKLLVVIHSKVCKCTLIRIKWDVFHAKSTLLRSFIVLCASRITIKTVSRTQFSTLKTNSLYLRKKNKQPGLYWRIGILKIFYDTSQLSSL